MNVLNYVKELKWKLYFNNISKKCKNFNVGEFVRINTKSIKNKRSLLYKNGEFQLYKIVDKNEWGYKISKYNNGILDIGYFSVDDFNLLHKKPNKKELKDFNKYLSELL